MRRIAPLLAAAWLCLGAAPAHASNGQIVGVAENALVTVDQDGSSFNTLFVAGNRQLADPAWSPDGNRVAVAIGGGFLSGTGSGIGVVDVVTRRVTVLTAHAPGVDDTAPSWSPDGTRIAFMRSDGSVRTIKPDGSGETALAGLAGLQVTWGPDGRFAFYDAGTIGVIGADGTGRHDLATGWLPQWSADGTRLVYAAGSGELRTVPVAGGASTAASTPPSGTDGDPDAAPAGDGVVFTNSSSGALVEDSHGRRQLTQSRLVQPDWQPCTAQTARCTSAPLPPHPPVPVTATNGQIAAVDAGTLFVFNPNPNATGEKVLYTDPGRVLSDPEWSPDGNHIAFLDEALNDTERRLVRYDVADGSVHTLLEDRLAGAPSWSPDGTRIFFSVAAGITSVRADGTDRRSNPDFPHFGFGGPPAVVGPDGRFAYSYVGELGVFEADGTNRQAIGVTGTTAPPAWSPDGQRLVYIADDGDTATVSADGGPETVVGQGFDGDDDPEFSPDGRPLVLAHYDPRFRAAIEVDDAAGGHRRVIVPHGTSPTWQPCVTGVTLSCVATGHAGGAGGDDVPVCISPVTVGTPRDTPLDLPPPPCTDPRGAALTFTVLDGPAHGTVSGPDAAGHRRFTPAPGFVGADVVHYVASNGAHQSAVATLNILVAGGPVAGHAAPRLRVVSKFRLAHGRISGRVRCDVGARLALRLSAGGKVHRWTLPAGRTVTIRLPVPRRWRHRKLTLGGTLTDGAGHRIKVKLAVRRR
jgi:Tol biopolymer transport system component